MKREDLATGAAIGAILLLAPLIVARLREHLNADQAAALAAVTPEAQEARAYELARRVIERARAKAAEA